MRINLVNRKTGKSERVDFKKIPLSELKQIGAAAAASAIHYFICVIAESAEDIDFIATNFANIPLPTHEAKEAIWTGDLAIFIMLNYPKSE
jgi:hypothetical protein